MANPAGAWLRQIIPKGDQIPKFLDEYEEICIERNEDLPAESIFEDDSLDGRVTLSHEGVHFVSTLYRDSGNDGVPIGFEKDELYTDLNQRLTQSLQSTVSAGNAAGQAAPTEELAAGVIHNAQAQAPDIQAANGEEKATCFQRATDSKESLNDPAPAALSSPWRPASLPFTFFDTHYQFTDRWFRQITPLVIRNTRSLGNNDILKALRKFLEPSVQYHRQPPSYFIGRRRSSLVFLSIPSPRCQTFRVSRRALFLRVMQLLYRPKP